MGLFSSLKYKHDSTGREWLPLVSSVIAGNYQSLPYSLLTYTWTLQLLLVSHPADSVLGVPALPPSFLTALFYLLIKYKFNFTSICEFLCGLMPASHQTLWREWNYHFALSFHVKSLRLLQGFRFKTILHPCIRLSIREDVTLIKWINNGGSFLRLQ